MFFVYQTKMWYFCHVYLSNQVVEGETGAAFLS